MDVACLVAEMKAEHARLTGDATRLHAAIVALEGVVGDTPNPPTPPPPAAVLPVPAAQFGAAGGQLVFCELCGQVCKSVAGLSAHRRSHERAAELAAQPASTAGLPTVHIYRPSPPITIAAHLLGPAPLLGTCSCSTPIADADAWAAHNQTVQRPAKHRLTLTAQDAS